MSPAELADFAEKFSHVLQGFSRIASLVSVSPTGTRNNLSPADFTEKSFATEALKHRIFFHLRHQRVLRENYQVGLKLFVYYYTLVLLSPAANTIRISL